MIRMGRNTNPTKPETPQQPETSPYQDTNMNNQQFGFQPQANENTSPRSTTDTSSSRAFTESESMARDIKEGRLSGFVGSGTTLSGETDFKAMLRVDGHLVGKVTSEAGTLIVGSGGVVDANVKVSSAVINGTVNGDIMATEKLELGRTAKVVGNIQTPSLMIEQGAVFEGSCSMMKSKADFDKRTVQSVVQNVSSKPPEKDIAKEPIVAAKAEPIMTAKADNGAVVSTK